MERQNSRKERLIVPTDFTSSAASRNIQWNLVPPSHFAMGVQTTGAHRPTLQAMSWMNPAVTSVLSGDHCPTNPRPGMTQAQQEILELRKENQRMMLLQEESIRGNTFVDHMSGIRMRSAERTEQWSRWESQWRLEAEKHKAEVERLKGQVEALKETAERYREEIKGKDITLSRQNHELEVMHEELSKTKTEVREIREELNLSSAQKQKISSQLEKLTAESDEEMTKLRTDVERGKEECRALALKAEMSRMQAEEKAKNQSLRLLKQMEEMKMKQEVQLQQLNASHCAELSAARKTNGELQDQLQSIASEVLQLKSTVTEVSTERDGLKEHLSQMGQAFETQSATLHSLRNYIGQLGPEKGEKEQLNEALERLNKEKTALQMTTELLTVRLNSVNEILALQEEKIIKRTSTDPLLMNSSEGLQVLQLWREKVFKLCVQLRSKDIEIKREKDKLLSEVRSMEQQLQQEQHCVSVLQHSLQDRMAELDLERVEKETMKQKLAKVHKENAELKLQSQKAEADIKALTKTVQRFSQEFDSKVADVDAAKAKLNIFTQRLSFAKRRVETIQGLVMRRAALQKIEQACIQTEKDEDSLSNLQIEHSLLCEERDRLTQELKRTPELIEKALSDLKEQYESKVRQLEQSCMDVKTAVTDKEKAEQTLEHVQAQLEESNSSLERLRCELLRQQEHSEQVLLERVSEIEERCAEKLRELEVQVKAARREHTKAVMTLQQFQREAARTEDEMKKCQHLKSEHTDQEVLSKELKETETDKSRLPVMVADRMLMGYTQADITALQNPAPPRIQEEASERECSAEAEVHLSAERLLCVLEELHTLSTSAVNSSEDSAEDEGESAGVRPALGR